MENASPQKKTAEQKPEGVVEKEVNQIAEDLQVSLPKTNLPILIKLIALFTLVGGLSIAGSTFADIFNPQPISFWLHVFRFITGILFIVIAYGIVRQQRWALWLYGILIILGIFTAGSIPILIIPAAIVLYLYSERHYFRESILDVLARAVIDTLKKSFRSL